MATPRLWGWTGGHRDQRWLPAGLPRACGDGPHTAFCAALGHVATPRLWGWTSISCVWRVCAFGYPAPVGMDLIATQYSQLVGWLPRACGDGPVVRLVGDPVIEATPRLWGWTQHRPKLVRHPGGYPAPVGMDPT